jgi:hypothetical protein
LRYERCFLCTCWNKCTQYMSTLLYLISMANPRQRHNNSGENLKGSSCYFTEIRGTHLILVFIFKTP